MAIISAALYMLDVDNQLTINTLNFIASGLNAHEYTIGSCAAKKNNFTYSDGTQCIASSTHAQHSSISIISYESNTIQRLAYYEVMAISQKRMARAKELTRLKGIGYLNVGIIHLCGR